MAKWCFYIFLWCVANSDCLTDEEEHYVGLGHIEVRSTEMTRGNVAKFCKDINSDSGRTCECTAKVKSTNCMNIAFSPKSMEPFADICTFFHERERPLDPGCRLQVLRDQEKNCTKQAVFRFRSDKFQGDVMHLAVFSAGDAKITVDCKVTCRTTLEAEDARFRHIDFCSAIQTRGNIIQLYKNRISETGRECTCTANVDNQRCMNMSFSSKSIEKLANSCSIFHQDCSIQVNRDEEDCTKQTVLKLKSDYLHGHIMNISVFNDTDAVITITCNEGNASGRMIDSRMVTAKRKTAFICSHRTDANKPVPADLLRCSNGTYINVTNIYIGAKGRGKTGCHKYNTRHSGQKGYCCHREKGDFLFNLHCLKPLQDPAGQTKYDDLTMSVHTCDTQNQCNVSDTIVPIRGNNVTYRTYSSYFIIEYECSTSNTSQEDKETKQISFCENKTSSSTRLELTAGALSVMASCQCLIRSSSSFTVEPNTYIADRCSQMKSLCIEKKTNATSCEQGSHECIKLQLISWPNISDKTTIRVTSDSNGQALIDIQCWTEHIGSEASDEDEEDDADDADDDKQQDSGDQLPTYVIAIVAAGGILVIAGFIVTAIICVRKKRSNANKHVYMTVERTTGQELQTLSTRNVTNGHTRGDGFEDIPLASDNELDPLYDQADQQDTHNGGHEDKSRGISSDDVYDHTNNARGTHVPTMATGVKTEDEEDTYDHAGDSRQKKKADVEPKLSQSGEEDRYDHTGGPAGGHAGGQKDQIEGGVYGKLNHGDDVYDHATGQSLRPSSNTDCVSNTYGRLNMNAEEDSDVYNHTTAGKKKPTVIDEQYSSLKDA